MKAKDLFLFEELSETVQRKVAAETDGETSYACICEYLNMEIDCIFHSDLKVSILLRDDAAQDEVRIHGSLFLKELLHLKDICFGGVYVPDLTDEEWEDLLENGWTGEVHSKVTIPLQDNVMMDMSVKLSECVNNIFASLEKTYTEFLHTEYQKGLDDEMLKLKEDKSTLYKADGTLAVGGEVCLR